MECLTQLQSNLENKLITFEKKSKISNITKKIDNILKPGEILFFIDEYRKIIRNNKWNYEDETTTDFNDFLSRWEKTHRYYIDSALRFYEKSDNLNQSNIQLRALISETLRGRDGKRSKIGLDALLKSRIDRVSDILGKCYNPEEKDDILGLLVSTMDHPFISAETELYDSFYRYNAEGGKKLTTSSYSDIPPEIHTQADSILRNFCKYSFQDFNHKLERFNLTPKRYQKKIDLRKRIRDKRQAISEDISQKLHEPVLTEFNKSINEINALNYLNANLEVKYSFKGFPGLMHHLVFSSMNLTDHPNIYMAPIKSGVQEVI